MSEGPEAGLLGAAAATGDLDSCLAACWAMLARGAADRRSPCHHPSVATIGTDGRPRVRIMILREAEAGARLLRFHTDMRAEKVADLAADPRVSVLVYDSGAKTQIRLEGRATIHAGDAIARRAWQESRRMSRACYATLPATGTPIPHGDAYALPDPDDAVVAPGEAHFAVLRVAVDALEWLWLAHSGHRRARHRLAPDGTFRSEWLVP